MMVLNTCPCDFTGEVIMEHSSILQYVPILA